MGSIWWRVLKSSYMKFKAHSTGLDKCYMRLIIKGYRLVNTIIQCHEIDLCLAVVPVQLDLVASQWQVIENSL